MKKISIILIILMALISCAMEPPIEEVLADKSSEDPVDPVIENWYTMNWNNDQFIDSLDGITILTSGLITVNFVVEGSIETGISLDKVVMHKPNGETDSSGEPIIIDYEYTVGEIVDFTNNENQNAIYTFKINSGYKYAGSVYDLSTDMKLERDENSISFTFTYESATGPATVTWALIE